jgi:deoxycytidine triphosphate deaminase
MALLTAKELADIVDQGILTPVPFEHINGSSIDIRLGSKLLIEKKPEVKCPCCGASQAEGMEITFKDADVLLVAKLMPAYQTACRQCHEYRNLKEWVEQYPPVDFSSKQNIRFEEVDCTNGFILEPGMVALAHSVEEFNLPLWLTAEYRLKSSMARVFLEHLHASWCDPGWHSSQLTLEFVNMTQYHPLTLRANEKCGQVMFYSGTPVPEDRSYAVRGQYNGQKGATPSNGVK